jgi:hypothetical protein
MERVRLSTSGWKVDGYMARTFADRFLGVRRVPPGSIIVIPARSVHGFGLRQPLEVVGLDAGMRVAATATLRPNRIVVFPSARIIVELPSGRSVPERGDLIEVAGG